MTYLTSIKDGFVYLLYLILWLSILGGILLLFMTTCACAVLKTVFYKVKNKFRKWNVFIDYGLAFVAY